MKCSTIVFFACVLLTGIPSLMAQGDTAVPILDRFQADKLFREGLDLYNANKMDLALPKFRQVIIINPNHPEVYELLGEISYIDGDYDKAYEYFQKASVQHPEKAKLHNDMGVAAAGNNAFLVAMDHFRDALDLNPNSKDAQANLEEAQRRQTAIGGGIKLEGDPVSSNYPDESKFETTDSPGGFNPGKSGLKPGSGTNAKSRKPNGTYNYSGSQLKVGQQTDRYVKIASVRVTSSVTIVTFIITNPNRKPFKFKLAPPRNDDAWVLVDPKGFRSYRLRSFLNLPQVSANRQIEVGRRDKLITAYFEPLDVDVFELNILEGKDPIPGAWNFYNVTLLDKKDQ